MGSNVMASLALRKADTITDHVAEMYDEITKRAYEIFLDRGGECILAVDDWLAAERQLVRKPPVKLTHDRDTFTVSIDISEVDLTAAEIVLTSSELLFQAKTHQAPPCIFRIIHLPRNMDPQSVDASFFQGNLLLTGRFLPLPVA
jgi:hypothetical protein